MLFLLYFVYAITQSILIARYLMQEKDNPVLLVFVLSIVAPIATVYLIAEFAAKLIHWAVTGKKPTFLK